MGQGGVNAVLGLVEGMRATDWLKIHRAVMVVPETGAAMKTTLQWALPYIGIGWKVSRFGRSIRRPMPLSTGLVYPKNIGKHPDGNLAPHGVDSASSTRRYQTMVYDGNH